MKRTIVLSDVNSVFFRVLSDLHPDIEEIRYHDEDEANKIANSYQGKVVKVTKRMRETLELEPTIKTES